MAKAPPTEDDITSVIMTKAAHMAYETWRNWQFIAGGGPMDRTRPWALAPRGVRLNAVQLVLMCAQDADYGAEDSHMAWCSHMTEQGWSYADEYDAANRKHPNLVPFAELRSASRAELEMMVQIVRSIFKHMVPHAALERYVDKLQSGADRFVSGTIQ